MDTRGPSSLKVGADLMWVPVDLSFITVSSKTCIYLMLIRNHICLIRQRTDLTTKVGFVCLQDLFCAVTIILLAFPVQSVLKYHNTHNSSYLSMTYL